MDEAARVRRALSRKCRMLPSRWFLVPSHAAPLFKSSKASHLCDRELHPRASRLDGLLVKIGACTRGTTSEICLRKLGCPVVLHPIFIFIWHIASHVWEVYNICRYSIDRWLSLLGRVREARPTLWRSCLKINYGQDLLILQWQIRHLWGPPSHITAGTKVPLISLLWILWWLLQVQCGFQNMAYILLFLLTTLPYTYLWWVNIVTVWFHCLENWISCRNSANASRTTRYMVADQTSHCATWQWCWQPSEMKVPAADRKVNFIHSSGCCK